MASLAQNKRFVKIFSSFIISNTPNIREMDILRTKRAPPKSFYDIGYSFGISYIIKKASIRSFSRMDAFSWPAVNISCPANLTFAIYFFYKILDKNS